MSQVKQTILNFTQPIFKFSQKEKSETFYFAFPNLPTQSEDIQQVLYKTPFVH